MPYRVKIIHPLHREPYYWPGKGEEPADMSKSEAERVIEDCKPLERSLQRWAGERGERREPCRVELEWGKAERQPQRYARR